MKPVVLHGHSRPITKVKYNIHGDLLFTSAKDNLPSVWRAESGERLGIYKGHVGAVFDLDLTHDTTSLITAGADYFLNLWDVEKGTLKLSHVSYSPLRCVKFSQGEKRILYVNEPVKEEGSCTLAIAEFDNWKRGCKLPVSAPADKVTTAAWGYLNKTIITGHFDGSVCIYDSSNLNLIKSVKLFKDIVTCINLDKKLGFAIVSSKDKTAKILDLNTLEVKKDYSLDRPLNAAAISPIRPHVILAGGQDAREVTTTQDKGKFSVVFMHLVYEEEIGSLPGHFGPINTLAFNPDGKSFASGGEDGYVRLNHFDDDYLNFE